MKTLLRLSALAFVLATAAPLAHAAKDYQVTGAVTELTDSTIVVMKADERFEIARSKDTKVTGDLKVGGKVTVYYKMSASSIDVKGAPEAAPMKAKDEKPKKK